MAVNQATGGSLNRNYSDANPDGSTFGQSTTDTISFYGATPIAQTTNTVDLVTQLVNLGLIPSGSNTLTEGIINDSGNLKFTAINAGIVQKQGANGRVGTFVANGFTAVTVSNTSFSTGDSVVISLLTAGGTVGIPPHINSVQYGTSFTVQGTTSDSSTYNYQLFGSAP